MIFKKSLVVLVLIVLLFTSTSEMVSASPCSPEAIKAENAMRELLGNVAERMLQGDEIEGLPLPTIMTLESILREWYETGISPRLKEAETDENAIDCAMEEYFLWVSRNQLILGFDYENTFLNEIIAAEDSIAKGLRNTMDKAYDRAINHDLSGIKLIMHYYTVGQLLFLDDERVYDQAKIMDMIRSAARFELKFKSEVKMDSDIGMTVEAKNLVLTVDMDLFPNLRWKGSGDLKYIDAFAFPDDDEITIVDTQDNTLQIPAAWIYMPAAETGCKECPNADSENNKDNQNDESDQEKPDIMMFVAPGAMGETLKVEAEDFMKIMYAPNWFAFYVIGFEDLFVEYDSNIKGFRFNGWDLMQGELYAKKKVTRNKGGISATTELELYHRPE